MSELNIHGVSIASLAKTLGLYSWFMAIIAVVVDVFIKLFTGTSTFVGASGWVSWIFYVLAFVILTPIFAYIFGLLVGFVLNLALNVGDGIKLEVK